MGKVIGCCLILIWAVGLSATTAWAGQGLTAQQAVERLVAEFPQAKSHTEGPRITRVYGQPLAFGATPLDSAEQFRVSHAALFSVQPDDLEVQAIGVDGPPALPLMYNRQTGQYKFTLVRYQHHKTGIPVFRSDLRLLVRNEPGFPLVLATSSLRSLGDFVPEPASVLFDPARQTDTGMETFSEPETVVWAGVGDMVVEPVVAVTFIGEKGSPLGGDYEKWLFVADAANGAILYQEDMIILTDVNGKILGMASEGPKADFCANEVLTPMSYATASIVGGGSAYGNVDGDYTIPNAGTSDVTVQSPMNGQYFVVDNVAGSEEVLSQTVTPPGPADFTHNSMNASEQIRAQVNGYVQANVVRDFVLTYHPTYPTISTQTNFPVRVNRTDVYCPGNAWYDYSSINFCLSGGGYPNTAWSSVVHHEYGHHTVNCGGSGQDQYGEGMSDSLSVLIADDPILGYGFFGDCNSGLRTADNDYQYPCAGAAHDCGQLLSGCVWDTRNELLVTNPDTYLDIVAGLTVNSIPLHTGTQITPQITIDFLTLDDDDGNIGNGTPHRTEICAGFEVHNMDCPPLLTGLSVTPEEHFDSEGPNGGPFVPGSVVYTVENLGPDPIDYTVTKTQDWVTVTNGSGSLNVGQTADVTVSINSNANSLPDGQYLDTVTFTNTTDHVGDTTPRMVTLSIAQIVYQWMLDSDPGWTTEGLWAFGQPTGGGGQYGGPDPTSGYTGTNVYGYNLNGDYENSLPERHLTSAAVDCTGYTNVTLKFRRWLGVEQPLYDHAYLRVSNNGTSWTTVWQNTAEVTDSSWTRQEFDISSVADNQATVYLRWTMGPTDSAWQYCGWNIDDIKIIAEGGEPTCNDGILNQGEDRIDCGGPCPPCDCLSDGACSNGVFCDGAETCDAYGHCQPGGDPCPGQLCDEDNDICVDCFGDADCDDGLYCNGAETCVGGVCQPGIAVDCDDDVGCTDDACNEATHSCDNVPNDANCDNGLYCDGAETCDALLDCQPGTTVDCTDGVDCTDDSCNEATDSCDNIANDAYCDNGIYCDGAETCDVLLDCQPGTAVDCDDGVGCTDDACNEGTDSCDNIPDDAYCDDGLFCTGVETCDPLADCQPGSDPCPGEDCDEVNDVCVPPVCDDDGTCELGEDCYNCPGDCFSNGGPSCGNGVCEIADGEDCLSCSEDCNGRQTGKPQGRYCCGGGEGQVGCDDGRCTADGNTCSDVPSEPSCCGDGVCEGSEDGFNCEVDCGPPPFCGNDICDAGEDQCNCPADCGTPPASETDCADGVDNDCDHVTDCLDDDCIGDPACPSCLSKGAACSLDEECCSYWCHKGFCK